MSTLSYTYTLSPNTPENVSHVMQNFNDVATWANGNIGDDNLSASAGMYTAYRTIHEVSAEFGLDKAANTYFFGQGGGTAVNGASLTLGNANPQTYYVDDADYAISGRTTKLRVRAVVSSNATAPGINFTFGLTGPVTVAGGADTLTVSLGTAVSGSTVAINNPLASIGTPGTGSDFSVPADGVYALFVATSGAQANNNLSSLKVTLQQRWV